MDNESVNIWIEIYDCFFGNKKEQYKFNIFNKPTLPFNMDEILSSITNMINGGEDDLGEPDNIEEYNKGNLHYTHQTWETENGTFNKVVVKPIEGKSYDELTLEEKLQIAIENEEYEKASELKTEIFNEGLIKKYYSGMAIQELNEDELEEIELIAYNLGKSRQFKEEYLSLTDEEIINAIYQIYTNN